MAIMTDADRFDCWAEYMRRNRDPIAVNKPDLRAAFNAIDQYFSDNAASINAAIPQPARANLTVPQKALLAIAVLEKRYLVGA